LIPVAEARRRELPGRVALVAFGFGLAAALLGATELALRLAGAGEGPPGYDPFAGLSSSVPLFVPATRPDGTPVMRISPARLGRARHEGPVDPRREFLARKPPGGFRVFVVGESSAAGIPYDPSDAFAGGLARALAHALPGLPSEVVDAAVSGYGSRQELLVVREIAAYEPDLVVFYGGHNEAGARGRYGRLLDLPPTLFRGLEMLAASRTFTIASRWLRREAPRPEEAVERFLAEDAAQTLELFARAAARRAGEGRGGEAEAERWFRANVERIAAATGSAGAHLVLVTLGQDLVDWPPAASDHRPPLSAAELERWSRLVDEGKALRIRGDCPGALGRWRRALEIGAGYAELHFRIAGCERRLGRIDAARAHFVLASDLDRVPLGAPSRYNDALRELAARRGAILVDAAAALEAAASRGLVGAEFFADFIHPNLRGHQVIADAIVRELRRSGVPRPAAEWLPIPEPPEIEAIFAARPDYRRREAELGLAACLLTERRECAARRARELQDLDPGNPAARQALEWASRPARPAPRASAR
jgi:lysophospholipase L1-like esterase